MKIFTRVKEPTDWVSSLVIVEKLNGQLQGSDPQHLNQALNVYIS